MIEDRIEKDRRVLVCVIYLLLFFGIAFGLAMIEGQITGLATGKYPPILLDTIDDQNISNEGFFDEVYLESRVTDNDNSLDELEWSTEGNEHIQVTIEDGIALLTPEEGWTGTETIRYKVTDPDNLSDTAEATYTVYYLNHLPTIEPIENMVTNESQLITVEPNASDPDGDELSFEYSEHFNSSGEWIPPLDFTDDESIVRINVTVHDTRGGHASTDFFVTVHDINNDVTEPEIYNISAGNVSKYSAKIDFITDEDCLCSVLYGTEEYNLTSSKKETGFSMEHHVQLTALGQGKEYHYMINCNDTSNNTKDTGVHQFTTEEAEMPEYSSFSGKTTNFIGKQNITCIRNAILEDPDHGLIAFDDDMCIDFEGLDLDRHVKIEHNLASVDTEQLPELGEHSATIKLYDIEMDDPGIMKDGAKCSAMSCKIQSYDNDILTFKVNTFSKYEAIEKRYMIANESARGNARADEEITFKAQYYFYGSPIKDIDCIVEYEINGTVAVLRMEREDGIYQKTHVFNKTGELDYTIKCEGDYHDAHEEDGEIRLMSQFYCGDDECKGDENCTNCPEDCGECCVPGWNCTEWQPCQDGLQIRVCSPYSNCSNESNKPEEHQLCSNEDPCKNGKLDPREENIDCGGICKPCPSCDDGKKNQGETGVDCGGPCKACPIDTTESDKKNDKNNKDDKNDDKKPISMKQDEPNDTEENSLMPIIGLVIGFIVLSAAGALAYLKKDMILQMVETKHEDPNLVGYAQQSIASGIPASQVKDYLKRNGWDPKVAELSVNKADENLKEIKIHQMMDIVGRYDLSNPRSVEMILGNTNFPKDMTKEAMKRIVDQRYPHVKKKIKEYMSRF